MTSKIRTLMVGGALGTTALVGLGGGAVAWAQTDGTTPPVTTPSQDQPTCHSQRLGEADEALAAKLGKTTDDVVAARQTAHDAVVAQLGEVERPESRPTTDEERAARKAQIETRRDLQTSSFAAALGISVEDLDAARLGVAEDRLTERVASGELTQEQADARLDALRNGRLPEGPGGFGRDRGR